MRLKTGLNLTKNYSFNFSLPKREKKLIKFIVIHYTGMKNESEAIKKLKDHKAKVSTHYFIKDSGHILNMVPNLYEAWHAGRSEWKNFKSLNRYSIGIEINNPGHDYGYKSFSSKQIFSLQRLLKILMKNYHIKPENVLGHSDIAPNRKKDPGEKFPWKVLSKKNLCKWHELNLKDIKKYRNIDLPQREKKIFKSWFASTSWWWWNGSEESIKNKVERHVTPKVTASVWENVWKSIQSTTTFQQRGKSKIWTSISTNHRYQWRRIENIGDGGGTPSTTRLSLKHAGQLSAWWLASFASEQRQ